MIPVESPDASTASVTGRCAPISDAISRRAKRQCASSAHPVSPGYANIRRVRNVM
jgi:hypothetical protein